MPLFKQQQQKEIEKMKVVIYSTYLLDAESHRCTTELVKHMQYNYKWTKRRKQCALDLP